MPHNTFSRFLTLPSVGSQCPLKETINICRNEVLRLRNPGMILCKYNLTVKNNTNKVFVHFPDLSVEYSFETTNRVKLQYQDWSHRPEYRFFADQLNFHRHQTLVYHQYPIRRPTPAEIVNLPIPVCQQAVFQFLIFQNRQNFIGHLIYIPKIRF